MLKEKENSTKIISNLTKISKFIASMHNVTLITSIERNKEPLLLVIYNTNCFAWLVHNCFKPLMADRYIRYVENDGRSYKSQYGLQRSV